MNWSIECYGPKFQISYLQAVGSLRVFARFDPGVRCHYEDFRFHFSLSHEQGEEYWASHRASPIYSPWNSRAFGKGFDMELKTARAIPNMADYVAVVDASRALTNEVPTKGSAKTSLVEDMLAGRVSLSEDHTRWVRACWSDEDGLHPKPMLGTGGCEGSCDYGFLFARACNSWWGKGPVKDWTMGGLAFSPHERFWTARDVVLALEGALAFEADPWLHLDHLMLPLWSDHLTWDDFSFLVAAGPMLRWFDHVAWVNWMTDGRMTRMVCDGVVCNAHHRFAVEEVSREGE